LPCLPTRKPYATAAPFSYKDACVELNPHVGGNPKSAAEARKAVEEFLQALFKLG
jgi:hypothetical protein